MGGCSLARRMSQPDSPERATAKRAARVPTTPAAANLPRTGESSRPSSPAAGAVAAGGCCACHGPGCAVPAGTRGTAPAVLECAVADGRDCDRIDRAGVHGRTRRRLPRRSARPQQAKRVVCEFPGLAVVGHQDHGGPAARGPGWRHGRRWLMPGPGARWVRPAAAPWLPPRCGPVPGQGRRGAVRPGLSSAGCFPARWAAPPRPRQLPGRLLRPWRLVAAGGPGASGTAGSPRARCPPPSPGAGAPKPRRPAAKPPTTFRPTAVPPPEPTVPASTPSTVLLPAPLGPSSAVTSPAGAVKLRGPTAGPCLPA